MSVRVLETTLRVKGLSLERMLAKAAQAGIALRGVRRVSAKEAVLCVDVQDEKAFTRMLTESGYGVVREKEAGAQRAMRLLKRRAMLSIGAALFSLLVFLAGECVWQVNITGAGATEGEVRRVLREEGVFPGKPRALLSTQEIQSQLERQLPQIKYVDVRVKGMTLCVFCAQAREAAPADYGGDSGDIVARTDGIITQMLVRAGTPKVKVGDAVTAGQVLVEGVERVGREEGAVTSVAARAQVWAQTFYQGAACVRDYTLQTTPTGRESERTRIQTPLGSWESAPAQDFDMADVERTAMPIGGGLWPVTLVFERASEVEGEKIPRDRLALEDESAKIAEQIARRNIPIGAEVVDKWVDYSMIEEGFCAQVVLQCEEDIALAQNSAAQ